MTVSYFVGVTWGCIGHRCGTWTAAAIIAVLAHRQGRNPALAGSRALCRVVEAAHHHRMRSALVFLAGLVTLGGCVQQATVQPLALSRADAQAALQRQIAVCRGRYPAGLHFLDKARCDEAARREAILASGTPPDLADAYLARRADIAARVDRGRLTQKQADLALARAGAETNERLLARRRALVAIPRAY